MISIVLTIINISIVTVLVKFTICSTMCATLFIVWLWSPRLTSETLCMCEWVMTYLTDLGQSFLGSWGLIDLHLHQATSNIYIIQRVHVRTAFNIRLLWEGSVCIVEITKVISCNCWVFLHLTLENIHKVCFGWMSCDILRFWYLNRFSKCFLWFKVIVVRLIWQIWTLELISKFIIWYESERLMMILDFRVDLWGCFEMNFLEQGFDFFSYQIIYFSPLWIQLILNTCLIFVHLKMLILGVA